MCKY